MAESLHAMSPELADAIEVLLREARAVAGRAVKRGERPMPATLARDRLRGATERVDAAIGRMLSQIEAEGER